jgi:cephalosporin hydroxylase
MYEHFDKYLNIKELLLEYKPQLVVELGAEDGISTELYLDFQKLHPFEMVTISDSGITGRIASKPFLQMFKWINGISYIELRKFEDNSIDFCSIDTDHNYWTLNQELEILSKKMKTGGIIVLHDTISHKHQSIAQQHYTNGYPYPIDKVSAVLHKPMVDALYEAIEAGKYKILRESNESCGAAAIIKL